MVDQAARSYGQHVARSIPAQCAVSRVQHLPRTEKQLSALADRYMRQRYWLKPADHRLLATASELSMRRSSKVALRALPFLVWCLLNLVSCKPLEGIGLVTSVKGLQQEMYRQQKGSGGAYMLLNATGRIGSQGLSDPNVNIDAPLVRYSDLTSALQRDVVVLLPVKQSVDFMQKLQSNNAWQERIKGVLVDDTDPPERYSTVGTFPQAEYAPYSHPEYIWNQAAGSNAYPSSSMWFPMPVFLLTPDLAVDAQQRAAYNTNQDPKGEQYHASMKMTMTSYAAINSSECIAAATCKPLGGYSVWSAIPQVPVTPASDRRPILLVVSQMDSIDMFHDNVQGADGPLSGLIAMLGALSVLHTTLTTSGSSAASTYSKRIVFLALAGEPWGYMGSRRLLYEASTGSNSTAGLDLTLVEKVIEVGQVGRLPAGKKLFVHAQKGAGFGDTADILTALSDAAQGEASPAQIAVQAASASNPGIPPSSLMSFLRINSTIQGVVLAEFDTGFTNPYYTSRFDNGSTINPGGIASTAAVLAGTLHRLAGGDPTNLKVNMTDLQETISGYISCMIMPVPGFSCPLSAAIMSPDYSFNTATGVRSYAPKHYIGVMQYLPGLQLPLAKGNMARFLWNVMAFDASDGTVGARCDPFQNVCPAGQVCAGWRSSSNEKYMGKCVNATVQYVPSYSTKLTCENSEDNWQATWHLTDAADAWNQQHSWPPDPMWAESDWPVGVPDLQLYLRESETVKLAVLIAGLSVTAVVTLSSLAAKSAFHKHHKSS